MLGSAIVGFVEVCEKRGGAWVSRDVDLGGFGSALVGRGLGMVLWVVGRRTYATESGFQALHWNMLS